MATIINVHEAKTHLSRLFEQVAQSKEVVIARSGVPVARLVPILQQASWEKTSLSPCPRANLKRGSSKSIAGYPRLALVAV